MSKLTDLLNVYGADTIPTMERFLQDEEMYLDCLLSFSKDEGFPKLEAALQGKDFSAAFDYAHMLKGVAANLGLTPLYKTICVLVEALRTHDYANCDQQLYDIKIEKVRMEKIILQ